MSTCIDQHWSFQTGGVSLSLSTSQSLPAEVYDRELIALVNAIENLIEVVNELPAGETS
jgi:hypothetical protein